MVARYLREKKLILRNEAYISSNQSFVLLLLYVYGAIAVIRMNED